MKKTRLPVGDARELQSLVEDASQEMSPKRKGQRVSRAALLHLIDGLSRRGASGLATIAGASIYLAVSVGQTLPLRAAVWTLMVMAAIWFTRRLQSQYRAGVTASSRPFRWRAMYTSSLSVLGVAFSSAIVLLAPGDVVGNTFLSLSALILLSAFIAAMMHSAHLPAALGLVVPSIAFVSVKALSGPSPFYLFGALGIGIFIVATCVFLNQAQVAAARKSHPWTRFYRREVDRVENRPAARTNPVSPHYRNREQA